MTRGELLRKFLHIGMGFGALLLKWIPWWGVTLGCVGGYCFNRFVLPKITGHSLERGDDKAVGRALGVENYPVGIGILSLLFWDNLYVVAAAWALLAFGDGFASFCGQVWGKKKLPWNENKSWVGLFAFVVMGGGAASIIPLFLLPEKYLRQEVVWSYILAALVAALLCAFLESLKSGMDDNLYVPIFGAFFYILASNFGFELFMFSGLSVVWFPVGGELLASIISLALAAVFGFLAWKGKSITSAGAIHGFIIAALLIFGTGWRGFLVLFLFFVMGSAFTKLGYGKKAKMGVAQDDGGRRGPKHAWANAGMAVVIALSALAFPGSGDTYLLVLGCALTAAFATAISDTAGSEIGQLYGKTPILITKLKRVPPGTEGAVSLEGTVAGILASLVLGAAGWLTGFFPVIGILYVAAGAFVGTTVESIIGERLKSHGETDNEFLNFGNTLVGALVAYLLVSNFGF